ncbi:MAG: glutaredoxin-related protein [Oscillospiraceae bacterium]|nr:glutaredoxin-related protein [Oscillospiraceae bacterium]MBQ7129568.1 glutaredoxin-related protein [Oscillospiraceae bacterium]
MLKIFGSPLCPDCVKCKAELEQAGVEFVYMDITSNLLFLKKFLKLREDPGFAPVRDRGQIGIPCILREDGSFTFSWQEFL